MRYVFHCIVFITSLQIYDDHDVLNEESLHWHCIVFVIVNMVMEWPAMYDIDTVTSFLFLVHILFRMTELQFSSTIQ